MKINISKIVNLIIYLAVAIFIGYVFATWFMSGG